MAAQTDGQRWVEILRVLRDELPGEWTIRGLGLRSLLIREPIEWAIPWIGASKASSVHLHAGVAPALEPNLSWRMGVYGLNSPELSKDIRMFELGRSDDLDLARRFVDHALARIAELTPERYAERAEIVLAMFDGENPTRSSYLLMATGWRVVNDSGDPVEAARTCITWTQKRFPDDTEGVVEDDTRFYNDLIDEYTAGGREQALAFLTERRDRQLAEQGYDEVQP